MSVISNELDEDNQNNFKAEQYNKNEDFRDTLKEVILKKYTKASIGKVYEAFGKGILLVGIYSPFDSASKLVKSEVALLKELEKYEHRFKEIFFYNQKHQFYRFCP